MGILDNIGIGRKQPPGGGSAKPASGAKPGGPRVGARASAGSGSGAGSSAPGTAVARTRPGAPGSKPGGPKGPAGRLPGKKGKRKGAPSPKERIASAAAPLHDRRRRLVGARESTLRDLGGLMLEMYKRNRFREELLLDKCEEVLAIEVEIAHVDQRLFQLAPPNAAGMRPIGRCECGAPIHPGQNFCGVCGRSFATLTQGRSCSRCGAGLRPGDQYCATCGTEAPDALQTIEAAPTGGRRPGQPSIDAASIASSAVADTVIIEAPSIDTPTSTETPSLDEAPGEPAIAAGVTLETPAVAAAAPAPAPAGFDWTAPPAAPEAAIDTALDALAPSPTDPSTPFAGFPLTSTVPPPPIADPVEVDVPEAMPEAAEAPAAAPVTPAPVVDLPPPPVVVPASPIAPDPEPDAPGEVELEAPPAPARPAKGSPKAKPGADDAPLDPKAAKAAAKAAAVAKKNRAKAAKARAKQRAKAAREARKRGGAE